MMDALTDDEYERFLKLQELCPEDDPFDLYKAAATNLKSEKAFTTFLDRFIEQKLLKYGTEDEDEEERKIKESLTFAFTQQVPSLIFHPKIQDKILPDDILRRQDKAKNEDQESDDVAIERHDSDSDGSFHSVELEPKNENFCPERKSENVSDAIEAANKNISTSVNEKTVTNFCNGNVEKHLKSEKKNLFTKNGNSLFGEEDRNSKEDAFGLKNNENSEMKKNVPSVAGPDKSMDHISKLIDGVLSQSEKELGKNSKSDYEKLGAIPKTKGATADSIPEHSVTTEKTSTPAPARIGVLREVQNRNDQSDKNKGTLSSPLKEATGKRTVPSNNSDYEKLGAIPKNKNLSKSGSRNCPTTSREVRSTSTLDLLPEKEASGEKKVKNEVESDDFAKFLEVPGSSFLYVVSESRSPPFRLRKGNYLITNIISLKTLQPEFKFLQRAANVEEKKVETAEKPSETKRGSTEKLELRNDRKESQISEKVCDTTAPTTSNKIFNGRKPFDYGRKTDRVHRKTKEDEEGRDSKKVNSEDDLGEDASASRKAPPGRPKFSRFAQKRPNRNFYRVARNDLSRVRKFKRPEEKNFGSDDDNLSKVPLSNVMAALKNLDADEMTKKLENCGDDYKLQKEIFKREIQRSLQTNIETQLIREGYLKILKDLPELDPEYLLKKWADIAGDDEAIDCLIQEERIKIQLESTKNELISNLPFLDVKYLKSKAKEFLFHPKELEAFIAEENKKFIIDEQYQNMVTLLPWVDPVSLREKCEEFQGDAASVENFIQEKTTERQQEEDLNNRVVNMHLIFPDADPAYLEATCKEFKENDEFNNFLSELLEGKNYPKMKKDDPFSRERNKLWQRFVDNFDAKDFLEKVPNPEDFYSGSKGDDKTDIGLIAKFLGSRYPDAEAEDLETIFRENNNNLTNACAQLDSEMKPVEITDESFRNENIPESFLLEMVFILRRREIREHLRREKESRDLKVAEARRQNALVPCPCCYEEELLESEVIACPESHLICFKCVTRYMETKLSDGNTRFICTEKDCTSEFTLAMLEKILPCNLYAKVLRKRQLAEVTEAKVQGLETCPSCEFAYVPDQEDKIFKCQNPDCMRRTCRNCKEEEHVPLKCEEVEKPIDTKVRIEIEEKMSEALFRTCPRCEKKFVKIDGCNKMTCPCGAISCYLCRKPVDDYSHFNGQGGDRFDLCPLFSDNDDLHVREVRRVGVLARNEALRENPDVNLVNDPTLTV